MKNLKVNRGITLITIVIYIILVLLVIGMLATLTANFRKNVGNLNSEIVTDTEFDKLNMQLLKETKLEDNYIAEVTETTVSFSNGNMYEYIEEDEAVYLTNEEENVNIKVAEKISSLTFETYVVEEGYVETENTQYTDTNGDTAIIPGGFRVSGIPDEQTIEDGLVIYEIDVPEKDKMVLKVTTVISEKQRITEYVVNRKNIDWEATTEEAETETAVPTAQTLYNQYVWVPVEKAVITKAEIEEEIRKTNEGEYIAEEYETAAQSLAASLTTASTPTYPMAIECEDGNYRGLLYDFSAGIGEPVTVTLKQFSTTDNYTAATSTYYREPAYLTSYDSNTSSYNTIGITQSSLQIEYNNIVRSVAENGGFFVARYELIKDGTEYGSKRGKTVASSSSANMWYGLYSACQTLDNGHTDFVTSTMISGSQWDQIMIWMKEVKNTNTPDNYYVRDSSYMGNYNASSGMTGSKKVSGYSNNYSVKKIFDLGGNLYDWTTEAYFANSRVLRGNNYNSNGSNNPASNRLNDLPSVTYNSRSARPTLYVNL